LKGRVARFSELCPSFLRHVIFLSSFLYFLTFQSIYHSYTRIDFLLFCPAVSLNYGTLKIVYLIFFLCKGKLVFIFCFFCIFAFLKFVGGLSCSVYNFNPEHFGVCILIHVVLKHLQYLRLYFKLYFNITSMLVSGDPGRLGTPIYVSPVESPQPVGPRYNSCTRLLWKPRDPRREDAPIYLITFETSRLMGQGKLLVRSYFGNPATRTRKAHTFT
jgi:hypothetical protein